jgi:hypothetical protein
MKRFPTAVARLMLLAFTLQSFGCAYSTSDKIHVQSLDPEAKLYVDGLLIGTGSGTTTVRRDQTYTITAEKTGCAAAFQETGSKFDQTSPLGWLNDAPLISYFTDHRVTPGSNGQTSPLTYTVTPTCPPAASPALSSAAPAGRQS